METLWYFTDVLLPRPLLTIHKCLCVFKMGEIRAFSLLGAWRAWHSACGAPVPTVVAGF